jgi:hypothetical protein
MLCLNVIKRGIFKRGMVIFLRRTLLYVISKSVNISVKSRDQMLSKNAISIL